MHGNSIIPSAAAHDRHHAHRCTVCETAFTRDSRPAGEVLFCGIWADACADCYPDFAPEEDAATDCHRQHAAAEIRLNSLRNHWLATAVPRHP